MLMGVTACSAIFGRLPPNAERFTPPAVYARWWSLIESCSRHSFDMRTVNWYHVPGSQFTVERTAAAGYYNHFTNRLVLADSVLEEGDVVRHEMLHAVLQRRGHPRSEFLGACADLVICQDVCLKQAGAWRAPSDHYAIVPVDSLEISSDAHLLTESDGERWIALWVTVSNPRARTVAASRPNTGTPLTFQYDVRGPTGGMSGGRIALDSSSIVFKPFETKRWLFEFRVGQAMTKRSGPYYVRGGYRRSWAPYDTLVVQ